MYRLYKNWYPEHTIPAHSLFSYLYKNLHDVGSFTRAKRRVRTVINDHNSHAVLAKFIENPHISLRVVAGISIKLNKKIKVNSTF